MANPIMNAPGINSKLNTFFTEQLQRIYWAEQQMLKTLADLQGAASTERLRGVFSIHLEQTKAHIIRLRKVFDLLHEELHTQKCQIMAGITKEVQTLIEETDEQSAQRDVALIIATQQAEHYEIATYGGLVELARTLGYNEVSGLLKQTLSEEKEADDLLTQIAESGINYQAGLETEENASG